MEELEPGILRHTFALPLGIDHVHVYFLRSSNGGFILVDTALGSRDPAARWQPVLDELDAPVEAIVVSHMHPDHVGGARDVAELTGAPVFQGRDDHAQCAAAWGRRDPQRFAAYWTKHGMPAETVRGLAAESGRLVSAVHWVERPDRLLDPGDEVDGWRVELLRGHADGHIVLLRGDVMIAGDTILAGITPAVGLYPDSRPDPLGDYLQSLRRIEELGLRVAYTGHRRAVTDPAERARTIAGHHAHRLDAARAALDGEPRTAYDVSLALFDSDLSTTLRRFATAESLAHLERLVVEGRARREDGGYVEAGI
ncbi:MAG TPA: MBL fold metallo-hydrolase [Gaiellaceae bacterium]|jgi:glyoxylase-like metal-dependent hydrolase (beta-lactamase superfamily II)|nr:MBL fold metallo-hydrolase [Gaiellaceae bacterium]